MSIKKPCHTFEESFYSIEGTLHSCNAQEVEEARIVSEQVVKVESEVRLQTQHALEELEGRGGAGGVRGALAQLPVALRQQLTGL